MNYQVQFALVCLTLHSYDRFHAVILERGARWHSVLGYNHAVRESTSAHLYHGT